MNRVEIIGRLTRDVEVRKTNSGLSVAQFTVAVDRRLPKNADDQQPRADFISCIAWRQSADFLGTYAKKGNLVSVEGRLQTGSYTDKDGKKVYTTDVVCDNVQLLESRKSREATADTTAQAPTTATELPHDEKEDFLTVSNDDLPF